MRAVCFTRFIEWSFNLKDKFPPEAKGELDAYLSVDIKGLGAHWQRYHGCFLYYSLRYNSNLIISMKTPQGAIFLRRRMPTIALEGGYSESYEELVEDATLLLEGSRGRIGAVILVKIDPVAPGQGPIKSGFVEVHIYDQENKKRIQYKTRMVSFSLP